MRAVEQNTPPTSLDNEQQENASQCDDKFSSYAINLIRRLLLIADEDFNDISITDRDILEDVLTGTSLDVIARRRKLTYERIRQRAKAALDLLHQKLEAWQVSQQQLNDLDAKASQMEAELEVRAKQIEELQQDARQHVKEASQGLIRLDPKAAKALTSTMIDIGMPPKIATKLANRGIYTVLDAASLTKRQLIDKGASLKALDMLRLKLLSLGLDFGSDIRRVPGLDEYYIFPKPSSDVNKEPEAILPAPQVNEYEDKYLEAQEQIKALEKQVAKQDRQVERLKDKLSQMEVIVSQPYKIALEEKKNVIKDLRQDLRDSKRAVVERKKQIVRLEQVNERIIEELEAAKNVQIFLNKFDDRPLMERGVKCLQLRPHVEKSLVDGGVETIYKLVTTPKSELEAIEGITSNWLLVIEYKLAQMNLKLEMNITYDPQTQKCYKN